MGFLSQEVDQLMTGAGVSEGLGDEGEDWEEEDEEENELEEEDDENNHSDE